MMQPEPSLILARVGAHVRRRRQLGDLSLRELAEMSGLSPRFLSDVESGVGNIAVGRLARIATALGVPLTDLVRPRRASPSREAINALLEGRSETELTRLRHTLEVTLGDRTPRIIALVGIRGAGKSTIGPSLGQQLDVPFVELDQHIEALAGMSPAEMFAFHGEPHYRMLEGRCLARLVAEGQPCVVALPGGVVGNEEAVALLRSACFTVWLRAKPEDYLNRVFEQGDTRPTKGRRNAMDDLRRLVKAREPFYKQSDLTVQTSGRSVSDIVDRVRTGLKRNRVVPEGTTASGSKK